MTSFWQAPEAEPISVPAYGSHPDNSNEYVTSAIREIAGR